MKYFFYLLFVLSILSCKKTPKNTTIKGEAFGTTYTVKYKENKHFKKQFDSLINVVNNSMSTYVPTSIISKVNKNVPVQVDQHFMRVFKASKKIFQETNGVFDPTIGVLVNAWDFGPKKRIIGLDSLKIDSLMSFVGFNKVGLINKTIKKKNNNTFIDFNAIAKGYGVDVLADFLESKNMTNYLVEVGGEIRTKGINIAKQDNWSVGIEKPHFDGTQSVLKVIALQNQAMATSGTYRKYKIDKDGNRYAHIINPKTGYPSKTNILSVSVIAPNCMLADGYATAFKAMGIDKVKKFLKKHPEIKVFFVFENKQQKLESLALNNFPE